MVNALPITRLENFAEWYQAVIKGADLAETSPVRGCMVIKPWGWGIWELIQKDLDRRFKETGHENCYFPLFIPMSFISKEAEHVEGFAKEMAIVTHHRLINDNGNLSIDPTAKLEEPLIVRPTSETIIGDAFQRWIKSYRDLPLLINQWANVVRWEMRPRLFLRTTEFLWQEGHTAHANKKEAMEETLKMLEIYKSFSEEILAMPVISGEKSANERFPGAENTYSIESMMQDGKSLQSGTSHYLGTHFSKAQNIKFQTKEGNLEYCHTTSWGVSTRLIGGVIMTHGDDDGLCLPPAISPHQVVIIPILRNEPEDSLIIDYIKQLSNNLFNSNALGSSIRVFTEKKDIKSSESRWDWVRKGAPIIAEIGQRDVSNNQVTYLRRDNLYNKNEKLELTSVDQDQFIQTIPNILETIQTNLFNRAKNRLESLIINEISDKAKMYEYFENNLDKDNSKIKGWIKVSWSKPTGAILEDIVTELRNHGLTIRNAPMKQERIINKCIFTGDEATEEILIARTY